MTVEPVAARMDVPVKFVHACRREIKTKQGPLQNKKHSIVILNKVKNLARTRGTCVGIARSREILRRFTPQNDKG
ncbi:hypothetical protein RWV98_15035 [Agathobaculum sp. NTUH-O15-33]|uniref:hypothetical protein n=1 Tax=Agathobaculum sp. NTUH-O15-33 TaxID=3079302 RepID=UPI002958AC33|nr:hypothetical protein [Agathobaculum sp. NTUH-O15-33]WNX83885.1 hypothetical protein RWV98_15035 [Agathobaculum sp. NTUH-O15-33]